MLDLLEIVLRIAVELDHADVDRRVIGMRPDLGEVEGVVPVLADVGLRHDLHLHLPVREVAELDGVEQIFLRGLARAADDLDLGGFLLVQCCGPAAS